MKTIYLDCGMGAAGDMLCAALLELCPDPAAALEKLNSLALADVVYTAEKSEKCGITGTHLTVAYKGEVEGEEQHHHSRHHHHRSMAEIEEIIAALNMPERAKSNALAVYKLIAAAESRAHGCDVSEIHLHELGAMDAIADIAAACFLIDALAPEKIIASPVRLGYGTVKCAHGILPVPAPATAYTVEGMRVFAGDIEGEMCTPTGAALLKHFVDEFSAMPELVIEKTGHGMGTRDFPAANCVRAVLGEGEEETAELLCNVDDMTAEDVAFALDTLMAEGALDAWWQSIGMKKNRPGLMLGCLCRKKDARRMAEIIFRHTSTIGIRQTLCRRYILRREEGTIETEWGPVRFKKSSGFGVERAKPEHDDLEKIARKTGLSIKEIRDQITGGI